MATSAPTTAFIKPSAAPDPPDRRCRCLAALSDQFDAVYAAGRPPFDPTGASAPDALLIQAFYSVRSERQLMEQLNYNLLFRWFVGLSVDDPVWDPSTFSKNRDRVLNEDFAASFLDAVLNADR